MENKNLNKEILQEEQVKKLEKRFLSLEKKIWSQTNIPSGNIYFEKCYLPDGSYINYIEINLIPKTENKTILLLHGYTCTKTVFYKLAQHLYQNFHLIIIDLPGMNFNSKNEPFPFENFQTTLDYFMQQLKDFVNALGLKKFDIMGHSLGGFLSGHFYNAFPDYIRKVVLLSPAGFNKSLNNDKLILPAELKKQHPRLYFFITKSLDPIFKNNISFFEVYPKIITKIIFTFFYSLNKFDLTKKEAKLLSKLIHYCIETKQHGERCFSYLFYNSVRSEKPLVDILKSRPEKQKDFLIVYGEQDWMDSNDGIQQIRDNNLRCKVEYVENGDHYFLIQKNKKIAEVITNFLNDSNLEIIPKL
jgi:pimeloyl-ACP methyl ester carboxylesterase